MTDHGLFNDPEDQLISQHVPSTVDLWSFHNWHWTDPGNGYNFRFRFIPVHNGSICSYIPPDSKMVNENKVPETW